MCGSVPAIATSTGTRFMNNVWWKRDHAYLLEEDPGLEIFTHGLKFITEHRFKDDPEATATADLTKKSASNQPITVLHALQSLLQAENLDDQSEGEEEDNTHGDYGPQPVNVGELARMYAGYASNKRKRSVPTRNEAPYSYVQDMLTDDQPECSLTHDLDQLQTFQEQGATAIQCAWCEKWRFVCELYHKVPESTEEDAGTTFQCHELKWNDGSHVGLSCESYEQDFRPPNPLDKYAKEKGGAESEMKNFFEWWSSSSDTPGEVDTDVSTYRENYWEYLAHTGTLVPEGYADHPIHTMKVEDIGK